MGKKHLYRLAFQHQGELYEIYARQVSQGQLFGFVEVEGLVFGERSQVVVDPSEERLKNESRGVTRFHLPMHSVVRIDEVEQAGAGRISAAQGASAVSVFPGASVLPPKSDSRTK